MLVIKDFMNLDALVVLIAFVILVWFIYTSLYKTLLVHVRSTQDDQIYLVQNKPDKVQAANTFAEVVRRTHILLDGLKKEKSQNLQNSHNSQNPQNNVGILISRFQEKNLREAIPKNKSTSYSINKGEKIVLCIRNKNGEIADINTIMFVHIHELAHLMSISVGHNTEFWENMKFLIAHATRLGVYTPVDYAKSPKSYCGISITDTPLKPSDIPKFLNSSE